MSEQTTPGLKPLLITITLYLFSISLVIPIFPTLISYSIDGDEEVEALTASRYSTLQTIKNALDLVTLPFIGRSSDYFGRKIPMTVCLILAIIQGLLILPPQCTGASPSSYYNALLASRVLSGVSDGVLSLLFSSLTDLSRGDPLLLPTLYGKVGIVFGAAFSVGPLAGALIFSRAGAAPVVGIGVAFLAAAAASYVCFCKDSLPVARRLVVPARPFESMAFLFTFTPLKQMRLLLSDAPLRAYVLPFFFHEFSTAVYFSWILFLEWRYDWDVKTVGIFFTCIGVIVAIFQGCLLRPLASLLKSRYPLAYDRILICLPMVVNSAYFFILSQLNMAVLWFPFLLLAGFSSFSLPALRGAALRNIPPEMYGEVSALFSSVSVVSRIAGSALFPRTLALAIEGAAPPGSINMEAGGLMVVSLALAWRATTTTTGKLHKGGKEANGNSEEQSAEDGTSDAITIKVGNSAL